MKGLGAMEMVASPCPPAMKDQQVGDFFQAWGGIASLQLAKAGGGAPGAELPQMIRQMAGEQVPEEVAGRRERPARRRKTGWPRSGPQDPPPAFRRRAGSRRSAISGDRAPSS